MVCSNCIYFITDASYGVFRDLKLASMVFIEGMCLVALSLVVITISGCPFDPLLVTLFMSGWYFSIFVVIISCKNLSLQYVNSMNCILR